MHPKSDQPRRWLTPEWPVPSSVRSLSTLRMGGVSTAPYESWNLGDHVSDVAAAVAENRRRLRLSAGLPAEPHWLAQVHGRQVHDLDAAACMGAIGAAPSAPTSPTSSAAPASASAPMADAAVTRRAGRVCAILTADCLPVLLASASGDRVGAAHAGWRGLAAGVIEATVKTLGGPPEELLAWLGPAIGPRHFEVGADVREALMMSDPGAVEAFTGNSRGRFMADLYALARRRLARAGVNRVYGGGECTFAGASWYFSHRRDGTTGRAATLIWLENSPRR